MVQTRDLCNKYILRYNFLLLYTYHPDIQYFRSIHGQQTRGVPPDLGFGKGLLTHHYIKPECYKILHGASNFVIWFKRGTSAWLLSTQY